jgi:hypothetical protein
MTADGRYQDIPGPVLDWLEWAGHELRMGRFERIRLSPLICKRPVEEIVSRRRRLFRDLECRKTPYGLFVKFRRWIKASRTHPQGRVVDGDFNLLEMAPGLAVVASGLGSDEHKNGPELFWAHSYPLAESPFVTSLVLKRSVEHIMAATGWEATCVDATGYCTESRAYRRDTKKQGIGDTFSEMAQQGRNLHRVALPLAHFVLPMSLLFRERIQELSIEHVPRVGDQRGVVLTFCEDTFRANEDLEALCSAIRQAPGLGVTVVHLNPYLLAQVLDYWSGATVGVVVTNSRRMAIVPRCGDFDSTVSRISNTVFQCFGEGEASVERLDGAGPGGAS